MTKPIAAMLALLLAGCAVSPSSGERILSADFDSEEGYSYSFAMWRETEDSVRLEVDVEFDHDSPDARFWIEADPGSFTRPDGEEWEHHRNWSGDTPSRETFTFTALGPHDLPAELTFSYENPVGDRYLRQSFLLTITGEGADGRLVGEAEEVSPAS